MPHTADARSRRPARSVEQHDDRPTTVNTGAHPRGHPGYSETLPCTAASAEVARRLVRTAVCAWGMDSLADDGALVVTELVANAAQHTEGRPIRVMVTCPAPGTVRISVVDRSQVRPRPRRPGLDDERGRGLALVSSLTDCWGIDRMSSGKRVWGELTCEAPR